MEAAEQLLLSLIPGRGGDHRPNPFQVAPETSRVGSEGVSWPGVPPGVIVGRALEHQMLDRLVGAAAVWTDGRVPAPDPVKVSCYQWGMTGAYLCQHHALVPGPIPLPTLVTSVMVTSNWQLLLQDVLAATTYHYYAVVGYEATNCMAINIKPNVNWLHLRTTILTT